MDAELSFVQWPGKEASEQVGWNLFSQGYSPGTE